MLFCRGAGEDFDFSPVTPLKRSLREGYGTVQCACTVLKGSTACGGAGTAQAVTEGEQ